MDISVGLRQWSTNSFIKNLETVLLNQEAGLDLGDIQLIGKYKKRRQTFVAIY